MAKLEELMKNEQVVEKLKIAKSEEQFLSVLSENGVSMSIEELNSIMDKITESKELNEDDLQDAAGGWGWPVITVGSKIIIDALKCNKHTNWGRNGKKCICGYHFFMN